MIREAVCTCAHFLLPLIQERKRWTEGEGKGEREGRMKSSDVKGRLKKKICAGRIHIMQSMCRLMNWTQRGEEKEVAQKNSTHIYICTCTHNRKRIGGVISSIRGSWKY